MRHLSTIFFVMICWAECQSQNLVEIVQVDNKGVSKIVRTDKPDTLIKGNKRKMPPSTGFEEPIFENRADSLQFETTQQLIRDVSNGKAYNAKFMDSIFAKSSELRKRIVGYRKVYTSHPDFFPFDSLAFLANRSKIKRLSLSKIRSNKLPDAIFTCTNLEELELVNTSIARLQRKLNRMSKLRTVQIYNNKPKRSLKLTKNSTIDTMVIRGDNPTKLPKDYSNLASLKRLDLANNGLTYFPKGTSKNKNLKDLVLNNNRITLANDLIEPHPYLEKLDLGKNQIKKVPPAIQNFFSLKMLKFNYNLISEVDHSIANLKKLEQLSFYNNLLTSIPNAVYELRALKEIDLYYNQIERLGALATQWKNLEVLYLAFNKIVAVPDNLGELKKLQELYLHSNRLILLPESIGELSHLKVLRVNNNLLTSLPLSISSLHLLENLDVSNNSIGTVPVELFNFPQLKILSMVANPWEEETRKNLTSITKTFREKGTIVNIGSFGESVD
jgi:Leucine-rich repeat (LRR) protein